MYRDIKRFLGYSTIGSSIFGFELLGFVLLIKYTDIGYLSATIITFLAAVTAQYFLTRRLVFSQTDREWKTGYLLFSISTSVGVALVSLLMIVLVEYVELSPVIARIISAGSIGYLNYLFNLHYTFRTPKIGD